MCASLILGLILVCILGFAKLVAMQVSACEAGPYEAPLTSAEEWSASLDVALGLDMWSTTEEEQVDNMWDMVPMAHAWEGAHITSSVVAVPTLSTMGSMHAYYTLRHMCMV